MVYEEVRATGEYVVLKAEVATEEKEVKTETGLILDGSSAAIKENQSGQRINSKNGKIRVKPPVIWSIGPEVDLAKYGFSLGDSVIINDYDAHSFYDDEGTIYIVCKASNIQCVIKEKN
jgi:co-chaperonin GroES (HSP10)